MPTEKTPTTRSIKTESRKIAYDDLEFRKMLRESPGIIKEAIALATRASEEYEPQPIAIKNTEVSYDKESGQWLQADGEPATEGRGTFISPGKTFTDENSDLEVAMLGKSKRELESENKKSVRVDDCDYLKINFKGHSFFVKRSFVTINPGFTEFESTIKAKEALKDLNFIKVVEAKLGYQDKNESWYVSEWQEIEQAGFVPFDTLSLGGIDDYGNSIDGFSRNDFRSEASQMRFAELKIKAQRIENTLRRAGVNTGDLYANLFCNFNTGTFILLDVGVDEKGLGNPNRPKEESA